jgi:hypothetical protein
MSVSATADQVPRLNGLGEVVLHNLKNWLGRRSADAEPLAPAEAALIADTLQRFFDQAATIVRSAVGHGELAPDESERFDLLLEKPCQFIADLKTMDGGHALECLAAFLSDQYNRGGTLYLAIQGETFEMDDNDPLSLVERALVKIVRALAPPLLLTKGALRFRAISNERELVIDDGFDGKPLLTGIHIGVEYDGCIRMGRVKEEAMEKGSK